jgi:hypothetical protein
MNEIPIQGDLASMTARPRSLVVDGRTYMVHPLTLDDFGELQAWVDAQFPDPIALVNDAVKAGSYNMVQQQFLYKTALEIGSRGKRPIGTPDADDLVRSVAGTKEVLFKAIKKGDPSFDREQADRLFERLTIGDIARIFEATEADKLLSDPKA